ncbi:hypothetical protein SGLAM104S_09463 [Streptomyces glaucescens]
MALVSAGGEEDGPRVDVRGRLVGAGDGVQPPVRPRAGHRPHVVARQIGDAAGVQPPQTSGETAPAVVQGLWPGGAQAGCGVPVELPARPLPRVEQGDAQAQVGGAHGGGEPGRPGSDDGEVNGRGHDRCPPGW